MPTLVGMQNVMIALAALIAGVCGAAVGVLFTVAHRAELTIAGLPVPYAIVLGIVCAVGFLAAMRLLWDTRWPSIGGALGFAAAVLVISFGGLGGTVIVLDDALGWAWLVLAPLAALITIAWPRRRARRRVARAGEDTIGGPEKPAEEYP